MPNESVTTPPQTSDPSPNDIEIISPWPQLRQVSNDECWESLTEDDLKILGVGSRQEWERKGWGNPCNDPRVR